MMAGLHTTTIRADALAFLVVLLLYSFAFFSREIVADDAVGDIDIPVIDISPFFSNDALEMKKQTAMDLKNAAERFGCAWVLGWDNIDKQCDDNYTNNEEIFNAAKSMFELKDVLKASQRSGGFIRGYILPGAESGGSSVNEAKESFSFGYDWGHDKDRVNSLVGPNEWPSSKGHERDLLEKEFSFTSLLAKKLVKAIALALELNENHFQNLTDSSEEVSIMRVFRYFQKGTETYKRLCEDGCVGSAEHTDWGFLTLVRQSPGGVLGLEILKDQSWLRVSPHPKSVPFESKAYLLNFGDYLSLLTNGRFKSPRHRVSLGESNKERFSIVYFFYPNYDAPMPSSEFRDVENLSLLSYQGVAKDGIKDEGQNILSFGEFIEKKWKQVQRTTIGATMGR